jgi:hypothetical protein
MPTDFDRRPDPELLLKQLDTQDEQLQHERLKVFLGYASGVGKSFRMLDEGRRRRARGQDVVIGAIQQDLPPELEHLLQTMEVIPLKKIGSGMAMDVEAILRRRPQVCLVDGVAYNNPPGSKNPQRWQDVEELLAAGIIVITSLNLQHIEERREAVEKDHRQARHGNRSRAIPLQRRRNRPRGRPAGTPFGAGRAAVHNGAFSSGTAAAAFRLARNRLASCRRGGRPAA